MFDEMPPEHFHQFIASSRPSAAQLPHTLFSSTTAPNFPPFDHYANYNPSHLHLHSQFLLHHKINHADHHHKEVVGGDDDNDGDNDDDLRQSQLISSGLEQDRAERSIRVDRWSNEEVLELLRIRSNMEINWFPDFTWNHVSRKLAELGFKRSPENCQEKFEEESQHFSNNIANTRNYRLSSELEETCHGDQNPPVAEEEDDNQVEFEKRKRSKKKRFEKLKEFCEEIVNKMMAQQEELNNKLIQDMLKRDEEKVAKEEAWKKREMAKINEEIESRAQEHAVAKEREEKIIEFLNKFTSNSRNPNYPHNKLEVASSSSTDPNHNPRKNPFSEKEDTGKRWWRDEVLALINLRSNHYRDEKAGLARGPLWERISKGMLEFGYNRSARRCKEKWENINKYYRKTKDANKKRSVDSRTCPYFHQLSTLYAQTPFVEPENHSLTYNHPSHGNDNVLHGHHDNNKNNNEDSLVLEHHVRL